MRLLAFGKFPRDAAEAALFTRYAGRLKPALTLIELPQATGAAAEIKRREADALLAALPAADFVVALDQAGAAPGSEGLGRLLANWQSAQRRLTFVIGGAEGFDAAVLARADAVLSLGALTWPHLLVRVMLAEQLYRAQAIAANHPYHRAGRP